MTHLSRVLKEQAGQLLAVAISVFDRVVLTGVLYRVWGEPIFKSWSAVVAGAGLISLFEFGFNLYFNNRITMDVERGDVNSARHIYFLGNTIFALCALAGIVVLALLLHFEWTGTRIVAEQEAKLALILLAVGTALRISGCSSYALYRANRQYGRLTIILAIGEVLRIGLTIIAVLLGGGVLWAAAATIGAVASVQYIFIIRDARQRFEPHRIGFARLNGSDIGEVLPVSAAYFAQNVPLLLLMHLPVLALLEMHASAGLVVAFVLMRTLTGLPRTILQALGIITGQECGRRIAVGDQAGALATLNPSARAFAVLSGLATGLLLGAGREIGTLWTGDASITRLDYLIAGLLPMVLVPVSVLAHNILASSNAPYLAAFGRWAQLGVTGLWVAVAPIDDAALRMLSALSLGEALGFAPLAYLGMSRLIPGANAPFHMRTVLSAVFAAGVSFAITLGTLTVFEPMERIGVLFGVALAMVSCALVFPWLGLSPPLRERLLKILVSPMSSWASAYLSVAKK